MYRSYPEDRGDRLHRNVGSHRQDYTTSKPGSRDYIFSPSWKAGISYGRSSIFGYNTFLKTHPKVEGCLRSTTAGVHFTAAYRRTRKRNRLSTCRALHRTSHSFFLPGIFLCLQFFPTFNGFLDQLLRHTVGLLERMIRSSQGLCQRRTTQHRETKDKRP
jgi:hypothetical protein